MQELIVSTTLFYTVHSFLASIGVKSWVARKLGLERWYRLAYSLVSLIMAYWVYVTYARVASVGRFFVPSPPVTVIGWTVLFAGAMLAVVAVLRFGGAGFIGLVPEPATGLVRTGLHGRMRHPIYTGVILMCLGWLLLQASPATMTIVVITLVYLPIGIHLEERKLAVAFGAEYERYRREVPAVLPRMGKDRE
jgi:methanethiol S-methyltransferase